MFFLLVLLTFDREAQARRGEEAEVDPDQFQDPDNEFGLFAGTTYEADDEEADKIYDSVDAAMDSRRRTKRYVNLLGISPSRVSQIHWVFSRSFAIGKSQNKKP